MADNTNQPIINLQLKKSIINLHYNNDEDIHKKSNDEDEMLIILYIFFINLIEKSPVSPPELASDLSA